MPTIGRGRWSRFSLRGLFIVMTVCCVLLTLWSVYVNPFRRQAESMAALRPVSKSYSVKDFGGPAWHRWLVTKLLGEDSYAIVDDVSLRGLEIDDELMRKLGGLTLLRTLSLEQTQVTDAGLATLDSMRGLRSLSLSYSQITDRGIARLQSLPQLDRLALTGTRITDAAVPDLAKLPAVKILFLRWTDMTDDGAERLRALLPECSVYHEALSKD
jgi:Leucine Rich repeat